MAQVRHLGKAPIAEAVIDFRVPVLAPFSEESFKWLAETVKEVGYGESEALRQFSGGFELGPNKPIESYVREEGVHGYRFTSEAGHNLIQFRRDGFTFNQLRPYTNWDDVFAKARKFWKLYTEWAKPDAVERLAVRYINHLQLPSFDLNEYLVALPSSPLGLPTNIVKFLSHIIIHDPHRDIDLALSQAVLDVDDKDRPTIILDIDVYKVTRLESSDIRIWSVFEHLHDLKNEAFFSSITETTARLYE